MSLNLFRGANISASGMSAERLRMEVVANNIANAGTTKTENGGPYQRKQVVFAEMGNANGPSNDGLHGVRIVGVEEDPSAPIKVHNPNHKHADPATGMVDMPNIKIPNEMVDLITATRSYEANLKALTTFKEMVEQTLSLLRGNG